MRTQARLHRSRFVRLALTAVRRSGGDPAQLIRRFELPADCEHTEECTIRLAQGRAFSDEVAALLGRPDLGLWLARTSPPGTFGVAEYVARTAPTFADAIELTARFATLLSGCARLWVEAVGAQRHLHHGTPGDPLGLGRHGNEFTLASLLIAARGACGPSVRPVRVWFAHPRPAEAEGLEAFFGAAVTFGAGENGMAFDAQTLALPLRSADPRLHALLARQAAEEARLLDPAVGIAERLRPWLLRALPQGKVSVEAVARSLKMSGRTLQRRLSDEGLSFGEVLEEVRRSEAYRLLGLPGVSVAEVSVLLGYSDPSAFVRAFRSWTGKTPSETRSELRQVSTQ